MAPILKTILTLIKFWLTPLNLVTLMFLGFSWFINDVFVIVSLTISLLVQTLIQIYSKNKKYKFKNKKISQYFYKLEDRNTILTNEEDFVEGDLFTISKGDILPFDGVIIEQFNFNAKELVGFNEYKENKPGINQLIHAGSQVLNGNATIKITATGKKRKFIFKDSLENILFSKSNNNNPTISIIIIFICLVIIGLYLYKSPLFVDKNFYEFLLFNLSSSLLFINSIIIVTELKNELIINQQFKELNISILEDSKLEKSITRNYIDLSSFIDFENISLVDKIISNSSINSFYTKIPKHYLRSELELQIFNTPQDTIFTTVNTGGFLEYIPYNLDSKISYFEFENGTLLLGESKEVINKLRLDEFTKLEILGDISLKEVTGLLSSTVGWIDKNNYSRTYLGSYFFEVNVLEKGLITDNTTLLSPYSKEFSTAFINENIDNIDPYMYIDANEFMKIQNASFNQVINFYKVIYNFKSSYLESFNLPEHQSALTNLPNSIDKLLSISGPSYTDIDLLNCDIVFNDNKPLQLQKISLIINQKLISRYNNIVFIVLAFFVYSCLYFINLKTNPLRFEIKEILTLSIVIILSWTLVSSSKATNFIYKIYSYITVILGYYYFFGIDGLLKFDLFYTLVIFEILNNNKINYVLKILLYIVSFIFVKYMGYGTLMEYNSYSILIIPILSDLVYRLLNVFDNNLKQR